MGRVMTLERFFEIYSGGQYQLLEKRPGGEERYILDNFTESVPDARYPVVTGIIDPFTDLVIEVSTLPAAADL